MKIMQSIYTFTLIIFIASCSPTFEITKQDFPHVETEEIVELTSSTITVTGSILSGGSCNIEAYGIAIADSPSQFLTTTRRSEYKDSQLDFFEATLNITFTKNQKYYVAAYVLCGDDYVYGSYILFKGP